jgi:arginine deiminase
LFTDHHNGSGHAHQSHQAPDAASKDFVVASTEMVHKARMAYYHIHLKSDATKSSYAQTMQSVAASEEGFKQVQVYFYDDRAAYERDDKAAVGILSVDGSFTVAGYGNDVYVEGQTR